MQPPRRPPTRPPSNQGMGPQRERDQTARPARPPELQHVVRKPQAQAVEEVWLKKRVRLRPKHVLGVLMLVGFFFLTMMVISARTRALTTEVEAKRAEVKTALTEVSEKERLLQFSGTDEYIEQQARLRFGYINEGEIRFLPDASMVNDFGGY